MDNRTGEAHALRDAKARAKFMTGFESTFQPDHGIDVLETTRHREYYHDDLGLVRAAGVRTLRYPAPWHQIERERGVYDWNWMDAAMGRLLELGLDPIVDPIHHTSYPGWLTRGFEDPEFPQIYAEFVRQYARRYSYVKKYTPFNEPFTTAFFCGQQAIWAPRLSSPEAFLRIGLNIARSVVEVIRVLDEEIPGVQIVHCETAEAHQTTVAELQPFAAHLSERRFLFTDLILGRVGERHPLYSYITSNGIAPAEIQWFRDNSGRINVLGLDYYAHSEHEYRRGQAIAPSHMPVGLAAIARQYVERYHLPVMVGETNIRGFLSDRISWLKYAVEQCETLVDEGVDFRGFCWFPFVDSCDWDSLLLRADGHVDPVGIYWLDESRTTRHAGELSDLFGRLARGEIRSSDIPAYRFCSPVDAHLVGFMPQMAHWEWREP